MRKLLTPCVLGMGMLSFCALASAVHKSPVPLHEKAAMMQKASMPESVATWEDLDGLSILNLSDGTFWYYTVKKEIEEIEMNEFWTDYIVHSFEFTIYDDNLNVIGTIKDDVHYKDDEIRLVALEPASTLTKKFFNYDDKYELAISFAYNSDVPGINHYYTRAYTINGNKDDDGNDKVVFEVEGKLIGNMVDCSTDPWAENYFVTFVQDINIPGAERFEGYGRLLETYTKASYLNDGVPQPINSYTMIETHLPGDQENTPYMFTWVENGRAYFLFSQYEKRFFEDPADFDNDTLTPDNALIVDIYSVGQSLEEQEFTHEKNLRIPLESPGKDYLAVFYSIGNLGYSQDVIRNGNDWDLVLTKQYYAVDSEDTIDSYYLIDGNGNVKNTIFELAEGKKQLSDIRGESSQYVFAKSYDEYTFMYNVVNVPSGEVIFSIPNDLEGFGLMLSCDRIKEGEGMMYAFQTNTPALDEELNVIDHVVWLDGKGDFARVDKINVGKNVVLAQPTLSSSLLSPYYFNNDSKREYVYNVKRTKDNGSVMNELMLVNNYNEELLHFGEEGDRSFFTAMNVPNKARKLLQVIYVDNLTDLYYCYFYELPLDKFSAGGDGTEENPYLIESIGDFNEIRNDLSAHYKVVSDFDATGFDYYPTSGDFTGTLDGQGHTISNLTIPADNYYSGIFSRINGGTVKDLNFKDVVVETREGVGTAGVLAGNAVQTVISNVHINGLTVEGVPSAFGGIVGDAYLTTSISGCWVKDADINIEGSIVGGIVASTRTGSTIDATAFEGKIKAATQVGGIAGATNTGDEVISNCHVNATLIADNTVGGIVGLTGRAFIKNNYVEGEISTTGKIEESAKVDNGPCAGGVAGEMRPLFGEPDGERIFNNVVALSSLEGAKAILGEKYPGQQNTLHRIIGRSRANYEPEILDYDENNNPVYGDAEIAETGLSSNFFVVDTPSGNVAYNDAKSVDGAEMLRSDFNEETLSAIGFVFGDNIDAPWMFDKDENLSLFFEGIEESGISVNPDVMSSLRIAGGILMAEGCVIEVYSISGVKVLEGKDNLGINSLSDGIYVAIAIDKDGKRSVVKFRK